MAGGKADGGPGGLVDPGTIRGRLGGRGDGGGRGKQSCWDDGRDPVIGDGGGGG